LPAEPIVGAERDALISEILAAQQQIEVVVGGLAYSVTPPSHDGDPADINRWTILFALRMPNVYVIESVPVGGEEVDWYTSDGIQQWKVSRWAPDEAPEIDSVKDVDPNSQGLQRVTRFLAMDEATFTSDFTVSLTTVGSKADQQTVVGLVPLDPADADHMRWLRVTLDAKQRTQKVELLDAKDNLLTFAVEWSTYQADMSAADGAWPAAARTLQQVRALKP
jgi:hypothetical protein